jgi:hypothetical protein
MPSIILHFKLKYDANATPFWSDHGHRIELTSCCAGLIMAVGVTDNPYLFERRLHGLGMCHSPGLNEGSHRPL